MSDQEDNVISTSYRHDTDINIFIKFAAYDDKKLASSFLVFKPIEYVAKKLKTDCILIKHYLSPPAAEQFAANKKESVFIKILNQFDNKLTLQQKLLKMKEIADIKFRPMFKIHKTEAILVKSIMEQNGFEECHTFHEASLIWSGGHVKDNHFRKLTEFQRVNHFPKSFEMTRKDRMHANLDKMRLTFGDQHFDFFPRTFVLPKEYAPFVHEATRDKKTLWIVKPVASSRGRGIKVIDIKVAAPSSTEECIISKYISNPLLINGLKFDLRIYVAITSFNPLRIYIYEEGLTRFATEPFEIDLRTLDNPFIHLTNYSVNKKHTNYVTNTDAKQDMVGSKWSLTALRRFLKNIAHDESLLWRQIHDLIIKTIVSIEPIVNAASQQTLQQNVSCFELFGFDILLDSNFKPWLLEVNLTPSLNYDTPLDLAIKSSLIADLLTLVGIRAFDKKSLTLQGLKTKPAFSNDPLHRYSLKSKCSELEDNQYLYSKYDMSDMTSEEKTILKEAIDEHERRGKFTRIYPTEHTHVYHQFFEQKRYLNGLLEEKLFKVRGNSTYSALKRTRDISTELRGHAMTIQTRVISSKKLQPIMCEIDSVMEKQKYKTPEINPSYILDQGTSSPSRTPYIASRSLKTTSHGMRPTILKSSRPPTDYFKHMLEHPLVSFPEPVQLLDLFETRRTKKKTTNSLRPLLETTSPSHFISNNLSINDQALKANKSPTSQLPVMIKYPSLNDGTKMPSLIIQPQQIYSPSKKTKEQKAS